MIKAVVFDLGGVVYRSGSAAFITHLSKKHSIGEAFVSSVITGDISNTYRRGEITRDAFWTEVIKQLGIKASADELEAIWIDQFELIEETTTLLSELKDSYALYYLSNNTRERVEKIDKKHTFLMWFEGGIFSQDIGVQKPDSSIYAEAIKKTNFLPEEIVFIDDKGENLVPAEALRMNVLLFTTPKQLREDLIKLGVIISL